MDIIWKPIPGYENKYEISNYGEIRSFSRNWTKPKTLKPVITEDGYFRVKLYQPKHSFTVHVLVAMAFLGVRPKEHQINHLDGNKQNNFIENLEYCTAQRNVLHKTRVLGKSRGESAPASKLTEKEVIEILSRTSESNEDLALKYHVSDSTISSIRNRVTWTYLTDYKKKSRREKIANDRIEEIILRYKSGESQTSIALSLEVHPSTISNIIGKKRAYD